MLLIACIHLVMDDGSSMLKGLVGPVSPAETISHSEDSLSVQEARSGLHKDGPKQLQPKG